MKIEIRRMERVKEGTLIYALVPELERPVTPHYVTGDTEKEKEKKRKKWREEGIIYDKKQKEIELLHLGEAELTQKEDKK